MKHPCIYEDENVRLALEICQDGAPFLHCTVKKWTHNTYKEFKNIWEEVKAVLKIKKYTALYAPEMDEKLYKFAHKFGFERTDMVTTGEDGELRRVLKCHKL